MNALNVLYTNPDKDAKEKANAWLADFQKSVSLSLFVRPSSPLGRLGAGVPVEEHCFGRVLELLESPSLKMLSWTTRCHLAVSRDCTSETITDQPALRQTEAWATSQMILFAPDAPIEPKLFAAQTFRNKVRAPVCVRRVVELEGLV